VLVVGGELHGEGQGVSARNQASLALNEAPRHRGTLPAGVTPR
jgi:hypothetical protein